MPTSHYHHYHHSNIQSNSLSTLWPNIQTSSTFSKEFAHDVSLHTYTTTTTTTTTISDIETDTSSETDTSDTSISDDNVQSELKEETIQQQQYIENQELFMENHQPLLVPVVQPLPPSNFNPKTFLLFWYLSQNNALFLQNMKQGVLCQLQHQMVYQIQKSRKRIQFRNSILRNLRLRTMNKKDMADFSSLQEIISHTLNDGDDNDNNHLSYYYDQYLQSCASLFLRQNEEVVLSTSTESSLTDNTIIMEEAEQKEMSSLSPLLKWVGFEKSVGNQLFVSPITRTLLAITKLTQKDNGDKLPLLSSNNSIHISPSKTSYTSESTKEVADMRAYTLFLFILNSLPATSGMTSTNASMIAEESIANVAVLADDQQATKEIPAYGDLIEDDDYSNVSTFYMAPETTVLVQPIEIKESQDLPSISTDNVIIDVHVPTLDASVSVSVSVSADERLQDYQTRAMPIVKSFVTNDFNPYPLLTNQHVQTILGAFLRKKPGNPYMRIPMKSNMSFNEQEGDVQIPSEDFPIGHELPSSDNKEITSQKEDDVTLYEDIIIENEDDVDRNIKSENYFDATNEEAEDGDESFFKTTATNIR